MIDKSPLRSVGRAAFPWVALHSLFITTLKYHICSSQNPSIRLEFNELFLAERNAK